MKRLRGRRKHGVVGEALKSSKIKRVQGLPGQEQEVSCRQPGSEGGHSEKEYSC